MKTTPKTKVNRASTLKFLTVLFATVSTFILLPSARAIVSTNVYISQTAPWHGWMNWYNNWTDYTNGVTSPGGSSAWGIAALPAVFNPAYAAITIAPNTSVYNPSDPYWVNPDGSGAKIMEGNFYVDDDGLTNKLVIFSGNCWASTLVQPYYAKAFIKVFNADYSAFVALTNKLVVAGQAFTISVFAPTGSHPQYGLFLVGPDANPATADSLGYALISSNPLPANVTIAAPPQPAYGIVGGSAKFSALVFGSTLSYQWKKDGVNLANSSSVLGATTSALTLNNLTQDSQAIYTISATDGSTTATASARLTVVDPNHLTVDLNAPWVAFMNWYINNNGSMAAYVGGGNWSLQELRASIGNGAITFLPNTNVYNPIDPYWVNVDGTGAKWMEALFYQQWDGLGGQTITFTGYCPSNTLAAPYSTKAYVREFLPDYSSFDEATVTLVPGQQFTVSKPTGAGDHVQWGFSTSGPDANPATVAALGFAQAAPVAPPVLQVKRNGALIDLSFPSETGYAYQLKYKTNFTDAFWKTLGTANGTGSTVTLQDTPGATPRYYALFIQ